MEHRSVAVLGAGMVGVSCALALQQRGFAVTLVDGQPPGEGTSHGNAGVFATSSVIPLNNPQLWRSLPRLLSNQTPQLRLHWPTVRRQAPWLLRFLWQTRPTAFQATAQALHQLIGLSMTTHSRWMPAAQVGHRLRTNGWLLLQRQPATPASTQWTRGLYDQLGVAYEALSAADLTDLEPALKPIFSHGLWLKDSASVDDPAAVVKAYADWLVQLGGRVWQRPATGLRRVERRWQVQLANHPDLSVDHVVVALGPWSAEWLSAHLGLKVPMAHERGYHLHYPLQSASPLHRPFHDASGGYVVSPMSQGLRLTSGVEFTHPNAPAQTQQLQQAEEAARQALDLGPALLPQAWVGSRPSLPDSRPVIGPSSRHPGLWLAFGHQHIGLSTGAGTGELLADLMSQTPARIDPTPFAAGRFGL